MERKNAWTTYDEMKLDAVEALATRYRQFLDAAKTEREFVREAVKRAEARGFVPMQSVESAKPGDRLYVNWKGKSLVLFIVGEAPLEAGANVLGAHIDSPRMDVKQNPLYEDDGLAYLDTHYYGGIKKYQWVALPMALHGVVVKKDGSVIQICIGEAEDDPVVGVSDLLIHLSQDQLEKKARVVIEGEQLDVIVGSKPDPEAGEKEKTPVKAAIVKLLKERYDFDEEDFVSAELEVVPAGRCRDFGLDRSMLIGYGHDDRVCGYTSLEAMLNQPEVPKRTCVCLLSDKEEIGSVGATGMKARYFENAVAELMNLTGEYSELKLRRMLASCRMLSCDVSAGYDPNFASVFEKKNAAYLGRGVCFNKFLGRGGKAGANDANAEFIARLRRMLDDAGVNYQTAELGKVDVGGGGTIAYICARYGMEVIDSGLAVLSMHSPWEIVNKADLYEAVRAYSVFLGH